MQTVRVQAHVGADGMLRVEIPVGVQHVDMDVVLVFDAQPTTAPMPDPEWASFVNRMYGALADDPIERPAQLPLEERDAIE